MRGVSFEPVLLEAGLQGEAGAVEQHPKVALGNSGKAANLGGREAIDFAQEEDSGGGGRKLGGAAVEDVPEFLAGEEVFRGIPVERF